MFEFYSQNRSVSNVQPCGSPCAREPHRSNLQIVFDLSHHGLRSRSFLYREETMDTCVHGKKRIDDATIVHTTMITCPKTKSNYSNGTPTSRCNTFLHQVAVQRECTFSDVKLSPLCPRHVALISH